MKTSREFLGSKVFNLLILSIFAGFTLSAVEVVFSILIQSFLLSMGILAVSASAVPSWAPQTFSANMIALAIFAAIRGVIQWFKVYSHSLTNESFAHHMKGVVARWALSSTNSSAGRVITFVNDRIQGGAHLITGVQNAIIHTLSISMILFYLFKSAPMLTLAGMGILVAFGLMFKRLNNGVRRAGHDLSERSTAINERLIYSVKNLYFLKICRAENRELRKILNDLNLYFRNIELFTAVKSVNYAAPQVVGVLVIILVALYNRETHALSGGAFMSFLYLFIRCSQTLADLSTASATIRMYRPQFDELYTWWTNEGRLTAEEKPVLAPFSSVQLPPTAWKIEKVSFGYDSQLVLNNFALTTQAGAITVIKGPSGAGKSTLLHLLSGLLTPTHGKIDVNGDTRFGYVGPDPHVIDGTVRENLIYGLDYDPSDGEIIAALEEAHCREFLPQLPEDLEKHISDRGDGLSTGQKQRLSLARALLRKPTALLLDEPTANLDQASATVVVEALKRLRGRTSMIIVTHHQSLVGIADKVVEF